LKFHDEEELKSVIDDMEIKINQHIEDKAMDEVKEEETLIINMDQTTLVEEVNQKGLQIAIFNVEEEDT
jgi:hypothetical protein